MNFLNRKYSFKKYYYKLHRPNIINNDVYIDHIQNQHRDIVVLFPDTEFLLKRDDVKIIIKKNNTLTRKVNLINKMKQSF